jgi:membrane protein
MLRAVQHLRRAMWSAFGHSAFSMAKAAAYSAILSIFPALLVVTTLFAMMPAGDNIRGVIRGALTQVLPQDTMQLVQSYFIYNPARSVRIVAAYRLPRGSWSFWRERIAAFLLVPGTMVPMSAATLFLAFGHSIERWMIDNSDHEMRFYVILLWRLIRWAIALSASIVSLALIYHNGVPRQKRPVGSGKMAYVRGRWGETMPGAIIATASWFIATIVYGFYLTRFADYSIVYGSLGAGIATLVWLYMVSLSVLIGAEFNAQLFPILAAATPEPVALPEDPMFLEPPEKQGRLQAL